MDFSFVLKMMKIYRSFMLCSVVLSSVLVIFNSASADSEQLPKQTASETTEKTSIDNKAASLSYIEKFFHEGMPYTDLRKQLLDENWLPLRDPSCWDNIGGDALICNELLELESCSGDGHCKMNFANASYNARIKIVTNGSYEDWDNEQNKTNLKATHLETSVLQPVNKTKKCPSQDFKEFLKIFASDNTIKQEFTAPLVKVAELISDDEMSYSSQLVYVEASKYKDFNINYSKKAFHFVDYEGKVDSFALALDISADGEKARNVRYNYGMSEGNSYRFELIQGCWQLTEDPEPPSP